MSEFLKNKYFFNEKSPSYVLIPEKDDFLGNSQSNTPNLQFQQNYMKINLEFNEIYPSMKIFFLSRKSLNFYLVRMQFSPTKCNLVRQNCIFRHKFHVNHETNSFSTLPVKPGVLFVR
jgi:hypothetical protein